MAQPPSQHDEDQGSLDDFAQEQPVVQRRHVDLESVVLWLADTWRATRRARGWYVGTFVLLIAGGVWLVWSGTQPVAPAEAPPEPTPLAVSKAEPQPPLEPPAIVQPRSSTPDVDRSVPVRSPAPPVEKPRPAPVTKSPAKAAPATTAPAPVAEKDASTDATQVSPPMPSPPMPRPVAPPAPSPTAPAPTGEEAPAAASAQPPQAVTPPKSAALEAENDAIREVVGKYRTAVAALDAAGVRQVWPSVNQRSLERAFRQLEEQDVFFFSCTIDVAGARANTVCVGTTTFIPKVGNRSPQSGPSQWNFSLSKRPAGAWLIDDVQAR